jgi:hypothetical protein
MLFMEQRCRCPWEGGAMTQGAPSECLTRLREVNHRLCMALYHRIAEGPAQTDDKVTKQCADLRKNSSNKDSSSHAAASRTSTNVIPFAILKNYIDPRSCNPGSPPRP